MIHGGFKAVAYTTLLTWNVWYMQAVYGQIAGYKEQLDEAQGKLEAAQQEVFSKQAELEEQTAASTSAKSESDVAIAALQQQLNEHMQTSQSSVAASQAEASKHASEVRAATVLSFS